jgi:GntR family transcriptional regulator, histidine utilization repressor
MGSRPQVRVERSSPLYEQVKRHVLARMSDGNLPEGARLPSEHELMADLGVSRMTVHRALRELSAGGYISRVQGVGSFVAVPPARGDLLTIHDIAEDIALRGHLHTARVLTLERRPAGVDRAARLELRPGAELFHSLILHRENGVPVQVEERFVTPAFAPGYLSADFSRTTTNAYLQGIAAADEVEHVVTASRPSARDCDLLEIAGDDPCLSVLRRTWVNGRPVTDSCFVYPGHRYSLGTRHRLGDV